MHFLTWNDLPKARQGAAITAAEDVIRRLSGYAIFDRAPLSEWDIWVLHHDVSAVIEVVEQYVREGRTESEATTYESRVHGDFRSTIDRAVRLVRSAIERDKRAGSGPLVEPRKGLVLPVWWEARYQLIYTSEMPWSISAVLQGALLGYPPFGERGPWRSR